MPEDYQAILNDLGVDTSAAPATQDNQEPNTEAPSGSDTADNNAPVDNGSAAAPTTPTTNQNNNAPDAVAEQRRNEAFAAMRSENSSYKKFMQHLMRGAGYQGTEQDFMKQLTDAAYKQEAARQGNQVSPEVLRRMDELESQNKSILESRNRELFIANLKSLQDTFNLTEKDIKEFIDLAAHEQIDLTIPGTNFRTLYQGLFFDKLKDRMVEEARQEWIKQDNKAASATNPDGKSGKKDPVPTNVNTMAEFDSLLQSIPKNKN